MAPPVRRGFTLVELLVVLAIIIALLAILVPSIAGAMEAARRAVCAAQQAQIGQVTLHYLADNNRMIPPCIVNEGQSTQDAWDGLLGNLLNIQAPQPSASAGGSSGTPVDPTPDLFTCPSDGTMREFARRRSYSRVLPDYFLYPDRWTRVYHHPNRIDDITRTWASTAYVGEWHSRWNVRRMNWPGNFLDAGSYNLGWVSYQSRGEPAPKVVNHRGDGSNFLFYDLHVAWTRVIDAEPIGGLLWPTTP